LTLKENGRLRQLLRQAGIDAEVSEVAQRLQKLLIAELHHRIKNILSMVQSIMLQTLRQTKSLGAAEEAIQNRIMALAHTHDLLLSKMVTRPSSRHYLKRWSGHSAVTGAYS
jgi:two-component sensor histidine kinase